MYSTARWKSKCQVVLGADWPVCTLRAVGRSESQIGSVLRIFSAEMPSYEARHQNVNRKRSKVHNELLCFNNLSRFGNQRRATLDGHFERLAARKGLICTDLWPDTLQGKPGVRGHRPRSARGKAWI